MGNLSRRIPNCKKIQDHSLARGKHLMTMRRKWKKSLKINQSLRLKLVEIFNFSPKVINKIIPHKTKIYRKRNNKKGRKQIKKEVKVMQRRKMNSAKAIRLRSVFQKNRAKLLKSTVKKSRKRR